MSRRRLRVMGAIAVPGALEPILARPGSTWTAAERDAVLSWFYEDWQLRYLLTVALRRLRGYHWTASPEDAEDAWCEFAVRRLDHVTHNYDPAKGSFWPYLLKSFRRFLCRVGVKLAEEAKRKVPLEALTDGEDGRQPVGSVKIEILIAPTNYWWGDPEKARRFQLLVKAVSQAVSGLTSRRQEVFISCALNAEPTKEVARKLGLKDGHVRVLLHRARQEVRGYMRREGIAEELL
jgi:RNA polymerase sigma factor (sigma-70 family)